MTMSAFNAQREADRRSKSATAPPCAMCGEEPATIKNLCQGCHEFDVAVQADVDRDDEIERRTKNSEGAR